MSDFTSLRGIAFDFDGTLVDSKPAFVACHHHAAAELGLPPADPDDIGRAIGTPLALVIASLYPNREDIYERYLAIYQAHADQVMTDLTFMLDGASEAVRRLHEAGLKLAIVSQKLNYRIHAVLERETLEECFTTVIGAEDAPAFKPDPRGLQLAIERLGLQPADAIFTGDTVIDAETARRANVGFIGLLSGYALREDYTHYGALTVLDGVPDLPALLGR